MFGRYKEIIFPRYEDLCAAAAAAGGGPLAVAPLERHGLHIWPRGTHFLMALADQNGSFTGTLYCDSHGRDGNSFAELNSRDSVRAYFERHYADAVPLLGGHDVIAKQVLENPEGAWEPRGVLRQ